MMRPIRGVRRLFRLSLGRRSVEHEVADELRFHLETRIDALMRNGVPRQDAIEQAQKEFGDVTEAQHELAAMGTRRQARVARTEWWRGVLVDARVAMRGYRRQPGFTVVVVVTLALGIGTTTAIFSAVDAVLLRPLPYAHPEQLVRLWETQRGNVASLSEISYAELQDWRAERGLFSALEGYDETNVSVSDANGADMVRGVRVTSGFLSMLGVSPMRGRAFDTDDDAIGGTRAVVLSHGLWMRRFSGDPDVVGRAIRIDGAPYEIRGILPPHFRFAPGGDAELWLPIGRTAEARQQRFNRWVRAVGRLRDGLSVESARYRMADVMRALAVRYPDSNSERGVKILPLRDVVAADVERPLLVLFGAVAIVLLIACANVASLTLARSIERTREIALRLAIGASRARIVRQLLTENLVLAVGGAMLGAALATVGVKALIAAIPDGMFDQIPSLRDASVDLRALGFTVVVALGTGVAFGLAPALLISRRSDAALLRSDSRTGADRARYGVRDILMGGEIALTLVLLVGALLMTRSLVALLRLNPGFAPEQVATVRVALPASSYADGQRQQRFFQELLSRVSALPGVDATGAISSLPIQGTGMNTFRVDGMPEPPPANRPEASMRSVAGDYFRALRIRLVEGRTLTQSDAGNAPYAVVINESLARRLFSNGPAVGKRIRVYHWQDSAWTIVGVVGDVKTDRLDETARPTIYYSHLQGPANRMSVVARVSRVDAAAVVPAMRREVHALDATLAVYWAGTMLDYISRSPAVYSRRYLLVLLGAFAAAAVCLAVIGVYGVIAYAVTQRKRELAIRIALGARPAAVLSVVMQRSLRVVWFGVIVGAIVALAAARTLSSLLFGVGAADAWTYGTASVLLVLITGLASYLPARRATHFDPATLLRSE